MGPPGKPGTPGQIGPQGKRKLDGHKKKSSSFGKYGGLAAGNQQMNKSRMPNN